MLDVHLLVPEHASAKLFWVSTCCCNNIRVKVYPGVHLIAPDQAGDSVSWVSTSWRHYTRMDANAGCSHVEAKTCK